MFYGIVGIRNFYQLNEFACVRANSNDRQMLEMRICRERNRKNERKRKITKTEIKEIQTKECISENEHTHFIEYTTSMHISKKFVQITTTTTTSTERLRVVVCVSKKDECSNRKMLELSR